MVEQPGAQANAAAPSMPKAYAWKPPPPIRARPASIDRVALPAIAIVFAILFWLYRNPKTRVPGT